jgi:uridine kinase
MRRLLIVGITGASGSGKTTISQNIINQIGKDKIAFIQHDWYYKDRRHLSPEEKEKINYDCLEAFENDLFLLQLTKISRGESIKCPSYDYTTHTRKDEVKVVHPRPIVLVEGCLLLADERIRDLMDIKVFVDADADIRFIRRAKRDISERGRAFNSVITQYLTTVRPMHDKLVEPTKKYADLIVFGGSNLQRATKKVLFMIQDRLKEGRGYSASRT